LKGKNNRTVTARQNYSIGKLLVFLIHSAVLLNVWQPSPTAASDISKTHMDQHEGTSFTFKYFFGA